MSGNGNVAPAPVRDVSCFFAGAAVATLAATAIATTLATTA